MYVFIKPTRRSYLFYSVEVENIFLKSSSLYKVGQMLHCALYYPVTGILSSVMKNLLLFKKKNLERKSDFVIQNHGTLFSK